MSFLTEIRPPRPPASPPDQSVDTVRDGLVRRFRRLALWLPAILAAMIAAAGLAVIAEQQSASHSPPIIRDVAPPTSEHPALIDLNSGTVAELATLPGIGVSRAEAIVLLRAEEPFKSLADLVDRGILRPSEAQAISELATVYVKFD